MHPGKLGKGFANIPSCNHGEDPASNKPFPGLVGTESDEFAVNEFATASHSTHIGHDIVGYHQENGKRKPEEPVKYVVHDAVREGDSAPLENCRTYN